MAAGLHRSAVIWEDFKWIRDLWQGPLVVKAILTGEDARHAVDEGASAIVVSNHGGRQLDCVSPALAVLREVIAAVDPQVEVLIDGGIRRGSDIVKAVCMGARAVLIGRAYAYGLAAAGEDGVGRTLEILRDDVERTLKVIGLPYHERIRYVLREISVRVAGNELIVHFGAKGSSVAPPQMFQCGSALTQVSDEDKRE
jgi:isopentenyl diphosphate isomerase/L-lactate dehydrogenase-like FMN-dependent dehydrogenase